MNKIMQYIKLMRIKHYIKNVLIFVPLFFSGQIFQNNKLIICTVAFISFCLLSSAIYCINDIKDVENDRNHPIKKNRPIASGAISKKSAIIFMSILFILSILTYTVPAIILKQFNMLLLLFELLYFILNICYSMGLKNIPIVDVVILASGFVIRLLCGACVTDIPISNWLYLTIMTGAFYLGFGKRRNEIIKQGEKSRNVLKKYNQEFLDKFMYACLILSIVFYSLWCIDTTTIDRIGNNYMIWSIPLLLIIFMKYSLNVENNSFGDPVDVILKDKILMLLILIFGAMIIGILYI